MQRIGMPLLRPRRGDRSARSTSSTARRCSSSACSAPLVRDFPALKIVFEHITTAEAVDFVDGAGPNVAATITPQHLHHQPQRDVRGRHPAACLLPAGRQARGAPARGAPGRDLGLAQILPRHRQRAARASSARNRPAAAPASSTRPSRSKAYAQVFDEEGALDRFEGFASEHGPRFYGLPLNEGRIALERAPVAVPERLPAPGTGSSRSSPAQQLPWRLAWRPA